MSTFEARVTKIKDVWTHPDADKLDLASVEGMDYQFCVTKGSCTPGDEVVYLPVDSILQDQFAEHLGIKNLLSGKQHNRIKTVKLRGQISQGVTVPINTIKAYLGDKWTVSAPELTEALGIIKYEPPELSCHAGRLVKLPDGISIYDIEGAQNFPDVVKGLMNQKVCVTEKLEGTNFAISIGSDGVFVVCQRSYAIIPIESGEHDFWKVVRIQQFENKLREIRDSSFPGQQITLRGELVGPGIQKNIYKLEQRKVFFFEVLVDHKYLPVNTWIDICDVFGLDKVPILSSSDGQTLEAWLEGKTLQDASNGRSVLADVKREGIVIRPFAEQTAGGIGRLIIKQRSPEYLASTDS